MDLLPAANNPMPPAVLQAWNKTGCDCNCIYVQEIAIAMMVILSQRQNVLNMFWLQVGLTCFHSLMQKIR